MKTFGIVLAVIASVLLVSGCSVVTWAVGVQKNLVLRDEGVTRKRGAMMSVYQKRLDLIENLVQVVKRYAKQEELFVEVAKARAGAGQVKLPENATQEDMRKFLEAQRGAGDALSRLLLVQERYPELKSDRNFLQLQNQLQQIESQSHLARKAYIDEIAAYNVNVRTWPGSMVATFMGHTRKPEMAFDNAEQLKSSPRVSF